MVFRPDAPDPLNLPQGAPLPPLNQGAPPLPKLPPLLSARDKFANDKIQQEFKDYMDRWEFDYSGALEQEKERRRDYFLDTGAAGDELDMIPPGAPVPFEFDAHPQMGMETGYVPLPDWMPENKTYPAGAPVIDPNKTLGIPRRLLRPPPTPPMPGMPPPQ